MFKNVVGCHLGWCGVACFFFTTQQRGGIDREGELGQVYLPSHLSSATFGSGIDRASNEHQASSEQRLFARHWFPLTHLLWGFFTFIFIGGIFGIQKGKTLEA